MAPSDSPKQLLSRVVKDAGQLNQQESQHKQSHIIQPSLSVIILVYQLYGARPMRLQTVDLKDRSIHNYRWPTSDNIKLNDPSIAPKQETEVTSFVLDVFNNSE